MRDKQLITILKNELDKKAKIFMHLNLAVTEIKIKKKLALFTQIGGGGRGGFNRGKRAN